MCGPIGSQPSLELLRQILDQRAVYERQRQVLVPMTDANFIATATTPGCPGKSQPIHIGYTLFLRGGKVAGLYA